MLAIYVAVSGGIFLVAWMIRATLRKLKFEAFDRHLGMLLGGTEGAFLGIVGTLFVVSLAPQSRGPIFSSTSGKVVRTVMATLGPVLPSEAREELAPFLANMDPAAASGDTSLTSLPPSLSGSASTTNTSAGDSNAQPPTLGDLRLKVRKRSARPLPTRQRKSSNKRQAAKLMAEELTVGDVPINLTQVIKLAGWVMSGGEAKALIAEGQVKVNGAVELRKRRKMAAGDVVELEGGPSLTLV